MNAKTIQLIVLQWAALAHKQDGDMNNSGNGLDHFRFPHFDDMFHIHNVALEHYRGLVLCVDMAMWCDSLDLNVE